MTERDRSRSTGPALEKWYQFLRWLVPTVEKFPRTQKFTLGDRIQSGALDVLERLIEATYSRQATPLLAAANLGLEKLRFLFRLASDLRLLDLRRYEFAARAIDEVGRLVGGWLKVSRV
ncbi:MAG: diversity-generating retroelement protein Avd [Betaproteobacteria bacterium]|nr:diversity-generating retroelement protein Avd [Betaproteobacteria bacterium]